MLVYVTAAEYLDECVRMTEDSVLQSLKSFCYAVIQKFGNEYFREPSETDFKRIMVINAARGFPKCVGSVYWQHRQCQHGQ